MGLFAKAASKTVVKDTKKKTKTIWGLSGDESVKIGIAVHELIAQQAIVKAAEAKMELPKTLVKNYANRQLVAAVASLGVLPETPMVIQNSDGEVVTFVLQDRSSQYAAKDEQLDDLRGLLGEDRANDLVGEETTIGFNRVVMSAEGVSEVVERHLEAAVGELVSSGVLTDEQAAELIEVNVARRFKPGTVGRAGMLCGKDTVKVGQFFDALGSSAVRYIKC